MYRIDIINSITNHLESIRDSLRPPPILIINVSIRLAANALVTGSRMVADRRVVADAKTVFQPTDVVQNII